MDKIKTILVDDEPRGLKSLQKLLQVNCPEVEIIAMCSSAEEAEEKILEWQPQLVFLDIAMPGKTGFEMLRELKEINFEIIFVTAHNSFMIQAFHFSAVDYLLKPVDVKLLLEAVRRAAKRIEEKSGGQDVRTLLENLQSKGNVQKMKLSIPSLRGYIVVDIKNIMYCEASSNYTIFHFTAGNPIFASKPIHAYEELLKDCNFVRIHKSYVVNMEHVKEYIRGEGGMIILTNGQNIDVSRRKKDLLVTKMKEYFKF